MIISKIGTAANNTAFIKPSYITNLPYKPYKNAEVLLLKYLRMVISSLIITKMMQYGKKHF